MLKLKIIYKEEFDIRRVINTIKKIDWYTENKYNYKNFSFPKILDKDKLKTYSDEEIKNAVTVEYFDDLYKENEIFLLDSWKKVAKEIELAFSKSGLLCQDEYRVFLTKYGQGGSYDLPNTIIINLKNSFKDRMLRDIIHEIIHLAIQKYIDEYKIGQGQTERIVDLFFIKNFPRRVYVRDSYMSMDIEKLDQIFDENFPDIKAVIEKVSE